MDVSVSGEFLYLFSGRRVVCTGHPEEKDPFGTIHAIRISSISSVKVNMDEQTVSLTVAGSLHPIFCAAGDSPNARVNWFYNFLSALTDAIPELIPSHFFDTPQRTWYSAKCSTRMSDLAEKDE